MQRCALISRKKNSFAMRPQLTANQLNSNLISRKKNSVTMRHQFAMCIVLRGGKSKACEAHSARQYLETREAHLSKARHFFITRSCGRSLCTCGDDGGNLESDGGVGGGVGRSHPHQHDSS